MLDSNPRLRKVVIIGPTESQRSTIDDSYLSRVRLISEESLLNEKTNGKMKIPQCLQRMIEYHPRAAEPHHCPDPLAHIRTVAVDRTLVALGLVVSEPASVQSGNGVVQQFPALITQFRVAVVLPTPQLNHMPDSLLFPVDASHTLILFGDVEILDHLARIANSNASVRDVLYDHASGTDGDIASYGHTRKDGH